MNIQPTTHALRAGEAGRRARIGSAIISQFNAIASNYPIQKT